MDQNEFERMKEAEKAHLRKLKELKQTLAGVRRTQSSRQALDEMTSGSRQALDATDALTGQMNQDAAIAEARMEIALESEQERAAQGKSAEELEEELRKLRAQELVRQMRGEVAGERSANAAPVTTSTGDDAREPGAKTIGRVAPEPQGTPEAGGKRKEAPAKTIGRPRP